MDNTRYRTLEVEGLTVTVDTVKAGSWDAFKLLRKAREATTDLAQFDALQELVEFATDASEERVIKHLGGEDAQFIDVVRIMSQIAAGCYPKN